MGIAGPAVGYLPVGVHAAPQPPLLPLDLPRRHPGGLGDVPRHHPPARPRLPSATGVVVGSFYAFGTVFALTQVPLALVEGVVTALIFKYIIQVKGDVMVKLKVIDEKGLGKLREAIPA